MDPFANWEGNGASMAQAHAYDAQRSSDANRSRVEKLEDRVADLEKTVTDLLFSLSNDGIIDLRLP